MACMLNSCNCDMMTEASDRFSAQNIKASAHTGLDRPVSDRPTPVAEKSRNVCDKQETGRYIDKILWSRSDARSDDPATRDLLLPKLMSGEIRMSEAEKTVEAVA